MSRGAGDRVAGKVLFTKNCATCHTLFGEGGKIGPDLTGADRKNRLYLMTQIIDPSAIIRQEFLAYVVNMKDGRAITGLIVESTPETVTLVDAKNVRSVLRRDQIDEMKASPVSLMPEKLLEPLDDKQLRDLFAYLQGDLDFRLIHAAGDVFQQAAGLARVEVLVEPDFEHALAAPRAFLFLFGVNDHSQEGLAAH